MKYTHTFFKNNNWENLFENKAFWDYDYICFICNLLKEVMKRFPSGLPLLDPISDMHIKDEEFKKIVKVYQVLYMCIPIFYMYN